MISTDEGYMRLEYFSENVAADKKRKEFDIKNHALCYTNQKPDFLFIGDSITEYWELNAYFRSDNHLIVNESLIPQLCWENGIIRGVYDVNKKPPMLK